MIVTFGDSVNWGQGLLEEHKFDAIVAQSRGLPLLRKAHSGAILGNGSESEATSAAPEIPIHFPTVWQQVEAFDQWDDVDLVLLNGGAVDVNNFRILDPWADLADTRARTEAICRDQMARLLASIAQRLSRPAARIILTGYYPVLSRQSAPAHSGQFKALLELHEIPAHSAGHIRTHPSDDIMPLVADHSTDFWRHSNTCFAAAADQANRDAGRNAATFVPLPFTEANALWAPEPLLWGLTELLQPEDDIATARAEACHQHFGTLLHLPSRLQCNRASVGHPNIAGAAAIARRILKALAN